MAEERPVLRRRHSAQLKAQVLAECAEPGASEAKLAMSHALNANIVHRWRKLARGLDEVALHVDHHQRGVRGVERERVRLGFYCDHGRSLESEVIHHRGTELTELAQS